MAIDRRSGRPDSEGKLMTGKFPAHPNPNNVEIPIASAMQAQARPGVSPDEDEIDDGRRERKNRMRNCNKCWEGFCAGIVDEDGAGNRI